MIKFLLAATAVFFASALYAQAAGGKVLYVYDEVNEQSTPYIGYFRAALAAEGISFDEAAAGDLKAKDLSQYDRIVIHGMVMAFNSKSPVRDWLKTKPDLTGKKVSLFVTANRWFLKNLFADLSGLLKKDKATVIDAVSMATKTTTEQDEADAVRKQVAGL